MTKEHAAELVLDSKEAMGLTWEQIAKALDRPLVWTVAALHGMHPMDPESAGAAAELFGFDEDVEAALRRQPTRVIDPALKSDPTIYRFHEAIGVYGPAIKALIHEQCGDGIMSAINFSVDVTTTEGAEGEKRIVVTFDGKYLPYQWS